MDKEITKGPKQGTNQSAFTFEQSRQAALACLNFNSNAEIVYRKHKAEKSKWIPLSESEIANHKAYKGIFAVILKSIGLCVVDFDVIGPNHEDGITAKMIASYIKRWGWDDYHWRQRSPSGGWHFPCKNPLDGVKSKTGEHAVIKGVDYLTGRYLMGLYEPNLWKNQPSLLKPLPDELKALLLENIKEKPKAQSTRGHGTTNHRLNSGFGSFAHAKTAFQLGDKCFEIVEDYKQNPGKTGIQEAKEKLGQSLLDGLSQNKNLKPVLPPPTKMTQNPKFEPKERVTLHKIIPRGYWITLVAETGTGKTLLCCHIIAKELKEDSNKKAYFYTQESDWSDNIVPSFLAEGLELEAIKKQVIFKEAVDYELEQAQVAFDINSLNTGDFVVTEPTTLLVENPNNSKMVQKTIHEFNATAKAKGLFMLGLHHTTTGWAATTLKEQGKFAKEWISAPRHTLILKEKKEDGNCVMFISKSNIMQRVGAIEFKITQTNIALPNHEIKLLKNRPVIQAIDVNETLSTKKILKTYFKHEAGHEKPKKMKQSTEELRGSIVKYIKDNGSGSPPEDHVLRQPMEDHCLKSGRFTKRQFKWALDNLRKEGAIKVQSGAGNRSEYRLGLRVLDLEESPPPCLF